MNANYHFLLARDSLDGLRYGLQSFPKETERRLLLIARDAVRAPLFLGHYCPPDYVGLSGLFQYDAEQLAVRRAEITPPIHIVFSSPHEIALPCGPLFDRLRTRLSNWGTVYVVLPYSHLREDLPPLSRGDHLTCLWDIRQPPSEADVALIEWVSQQASAGHASFHGPRLTCPASLAPEEVKSELERLRSYSPGTLPEPVRV
ncbi:MAG: hypothetical protein OHK005_12860 [Candidatus Methylacidiphilales bacterium]